MLLIAKIRVIETKKMTAFLLIFGNKDPQICITKLSFRFYLLIGQYLPTATWGTVGIAGWIRPYPFCMQVFRHILNKLFLEYGVFNKNILRFSYNQSQPHATLSAATGDPASEYWKVSPLFWQGAGWEETGRSPSGSRAVHRNNSSCYHHTTLLPSNRDMSTTCLASQTQGLVRGGGQGESVKPHAGSLTASPVSALPSP